MSLHAWIDIVLESSSPERQAQVVASLLASGWRLSRDGQVHALSAGRDGFDWNVFPEATFDWREYLARKAQLQERPGLTFFYGDTEIGLDCLWMEERTLSFSLSVNPVYLDGLKLPDLSWYLARLLPALGNDLSVVRCEIA